MVVLGPTAFNYVVLPTALAVVTGAGVAVNSGRGLVHGNIIGKQREQRLMLTLDNNTTDDAYPTSGGIQLSTAASDWGMKRNIDYVVMTGYGYHSGPTGPVTLAPLWVHNRPPTGPTPGFLRGFAALATGAGATSMATMRAGFPELPTTWTATLSPRTHAFYFIARGW